MLRLIGLLVVLWFLAPFALALIAIVLSELGLAL